MADRVTLQDPLREQPYHQEPRKSSLAGRAARSQPCQTGADGSVHEHPYHKSQPHDGNKVYKQ